MALRKSWIMNKENIDEIYAKHFKFDMILYLDHLLTKGDIIIRKNMGNLIWSIFEIIIKVKKIDLINEEKNNEEN